MKKVIQFIIGAVAMEYSLVAACYMDSEGAVSYTHLTLPTNSRV